MDHESEINIYTYIYQSRMIEKSFCPVSSLYPTFPYMYMHNYKHLMVNKGPEYNLDSFSNVQITY